MITTKLNGGLGNQLFQVAVAYAMALENNDYCAFDLHNVVVNQGNTAWTYRSNFFCELKELPDSWRPKSCYKQTQFNYTTIPYQEDMQLEGYFQSEKYFAKYKKEVLELFLNDDTRAGLISRLRDRYSVELHNSVSVHIRRGDYLDKPENIPFVGLDYYWKAIVEIMEKRDISCILVFSDDIPWCKENFYGNKFRYIEGLYDYEDMCLMSLCNHNIISNSSFSWWASYFNKHDDKIIYAPKRWFGNTSANKNWDDIYRKEMMVC